MKYFLDTNILIDNFLNRQPFNFNVRRFFKKADDDSWLLYVSDISFLNAHYVLKKEVSNKLATEIILDFVSLVEVTSITKEMLIAAGSTKFKDYEDSVQFQCAASIEGLDGIITRNKKDFKHSTIPIFSPEEVLEL